jgi:hypothetical protein
MSRLSAIRAYCPVHPAETDCSALSNHLAGSSATKQTYC